jgi:hypothetical protein
MNNIDQLNDVFNLPTIEEKNDKSEYNIIEYNDNKNSDIEQDLEKTRTNLFKLLEKGEDALDGILAVAQQSESPRCYEVFSSLLKNLADINHQILDIHKKKGDIIKTPSKQEEQSPQVINNSLFIGSTAELQKLLKSKKEDM